MPDPITPADRALIDAFPAERITRVQPGVTGDTDEGDLTWRVDKYGQGQIVHAMNTRAEAIKRAKRKFWGKRKKPQPRAAAE